MKEAEAPGVLEALTSLTDGRMESLLAEELFYPWEEA